MSNFCNTLNRNNKRPFCAINICGKDFDSLIDTGSSVSAMGLSTFKRLFGDNTFRPLKCKNYKFHSANGKLIEIYGLYLVPIKIGDKTYNTPIYVIKDLACSVLLGIDFINQSGLIINGKTRKLILDNKELPSVKQPINNNGQEINNINKKVMQESYGKTTGEQIKPFYLLDLFKKAKARKQCSSQAFKLDFYLWDNFWASFFIKRKMSNIYFDFNQSITLARDHL